MTETSPASTGQVSGSAAEIYESFFVPALLGRMAPVVADAAGVRAGQRVLDVACGTGVLARELASRVGAPSKVVGLDLNDGMLAVARRLAPQIDWRQGPAEALPFPDRSFDAVASQFGLMFFRDRVGALREMRRVARPGSPIAIAVWARLELSPGYHALSRILRRSFGDAAGDENDAPFALGDAKTLERLFLEAGLAPTIRTVEGEARFPSLERWMHTEVRGWTLGDKVDDAGYAKLLEVAKKELRAFVREDGAVAFPMHAHVVTARA